jgi:hypothetical protein
MKRLNLTGQKFNKLTAINLDRDSTGRTAWKCKCDCGNEKIINTSSLVRGITKSCGCFMKDVSRINGLTSIEDGASRALFRRYRTGALERNLTFNISYEFFLQITKENCYLCGKEPSQVRKKQAKINTVVKDYIYNGIDRLESHTGYENNNVKACCKKCNMMKKDLSLLEFLNHINTIINFQNNNINNK